MTNPIPRQPGDLILDRYMPNATNEEREAARENLRRLARLIVRKSARLARERSQQLTREKGDLAVDFTH